MTDIAIVTGGEGGLGQRLTKELARAGSHVVVADRDVARGQRLAEEISAKGDRATFVETDCLERFSDPPHGGPRRVTRASGDPDQQRWWLAARSTVP